VNFITIGGPLGVQLIMFWVWSNILVVNRDDPSMEFFRYFVELVMVIIALYLMIIQIFSVVSSQLEPLRNWDLNLLLEFLVPILIFINIVAVEDKNLDIKNSISFWRI